mmetsp:Transcript_4475/g.14682  ORF Transcript_4475/g.14682 Transcript_4475/m.14682 type:complete len:284 (+) Transcript_4475:126-977(+)
MGCLRPPPPNSIPSSRTAVFGARGGADPFLEGGAPLQVRLDLHRVRVERPLDLLIVHLVPLVDVRDVLRLVEGAPPRPVGAPHRLLVHVVHERLHPLLRHRRRAPVVERVVVAGVVVGRSAVLVAAVADFAGVARAAHRLLVVAVLRLVVVHVVPKLLDPPLLLLPLVVSRRRVGGSHAEQLVRLRLGRGLALLLLPRLLGALALQRLRPQLVPPILLHRLLVVRLPGGGEPRLERLELGLRCALRSGGGGGGGGGGGLPGLRGRVHRRDGVVRGGCGAHRPN